MNRVRDDADVLVLAGDLTNFGRPEEMESLMNALVRLRIPIVAVWAITITRAAAPPS